MGWGLVRNITREIILKHLEKRKKAMPMTIHMFGPGFQLTAVRFPEEQAADRQWNTAAHRRLSIPFCCISIALYCQSNRSNISVLRILQHNPSPGTGNFEMTHDKSPTPRPA
jgi:CO/xanthine dehydrogenase FAD-binding subunit